MKKSVFDTKFHEQSVESKIVVALERISEAFRVLLWEESKEQALSPIQIQILIFCLFHDSSKRKISFLANEFNLTKATISDSVKVLLDKKYVMKEMVESDNRSFCIRLTDKGMEVAKKTSMFAERIREPLTNFSKTQNEALLTGLFEVIVKLQETGVISINRMCLTCKFHEKRKDQHYCNLVNSVLKKTELRFDCNEHQSLQK